MLCLLEWFLHSDSDCKTIEFDDIDLEEDGGSLV